MNKRVHVLPSGSREDGTRLRHLLNDLGCVDLVDDMSDAQVVIVITGGLLPPEAELRSALAPAADGVFVLVGVHSPEGDGGIPVVLEDWATGGLYPLDADAWRAVLCDDEEGWFTRDGGARPDTRAKRECRKANC